MKGLFAYEEYIDLVEKLIHQEDDVLVDYNSITQESLSRHAEQFNKTLNAVQLNKKVLQFSPEGKSIPPYGGPEYFKNQLNKGILKVLSIDYNSISHWLASKFAFQVHFIKLKFPEPLYLTF